MDGLADNYTLQGITTAQRTLKASIDCVGVGLHSGRKVSLALRPAPADAGIVFRRTDLDITIPARFDHVVDTRLCTVLGLPDQQDARIGTVEHLMAALAGAGVHNAIIEVDGPEVPILDGSAAPFLFLIDCAGIIAQTVSVPVIEVVRPVRVTEGDGFAELRPATSGLSMAASIDFEVAAIGRQALTLHLSPESFRSELARARTFTLASEVEALRAAGLALGGSLDNAVVVDNARVMNPGGLRAPDEFVRHKLLDAVGDLALAGAALRGRFVAHRTGHALNNRLLRALFADGANWRLTKVDDRSGAAMAGWRELHLPAAAAPA
jgi:UDP-3-O-[3-hydroxymyristoyl] N-acetylglucosamine deacetylase